MNEPEDLEQARKMGIAPWTNPIQEDFHVVIYEDKYPVTPGHLLFVPQYDEVGVIEHAFSDALSYGLRKVRDGEWEAFNVGMNLGKAAGQTVNWPHVHLIPRTTGDTPDPTGGIRRVVKGKGNYKK